MNRITQKLDLERVALDAYSVVWEPSRKQVRDHQRATKSAIAAVLLHLSEAWSAVPEYQTNGHVQQTVGEFGGRLLIAASDLIGAGEDADLHALLSGEDRSEPTPATRVWRAGDRAAHAGIPGRITFVGGTTAPWEFTPDHGDAFRFYNATALSEVVSPEGTP